MKQAKQNEKGHWEPTTSKHWRENLQRIDVITVKEMKKMYFKLSPEELLEYLKGNPNEEFKVE